jgi:hypothetical protein
MKFTYETETAQCPTCKGSGMSSQKRCHAFIKVLYRDEYRCTTIANHHYISVEDGQEKHLWFCGIHNNAFCRRHNIVDVEEA